MESLRHTFSFKSYFNFRFPLAVSWSTFDLPISDNVGSVTFGSGMVENAGIAVGVASTYVSVQNLFQLPVPWPTSEFLSSASSAC